MQAIAQHDSSVVVFSSADAVSVDNVVGNGMFSCQLNNVNKGGSHAVKVLPTTVLIPNVFPNVMAGGNVLRTYGTVAGVDVLLNTYTIVPGYYTTTTLAHALYTLSNGDVAMSVSPAGRVEIAIVDAGEVDSFSVEPVMAEMLGFSVSNTLPNVIATELRFFAEDEPTGWRTAYADSMPHFGTTPVVYVTARQIGNNNMVASDSNEYDVIATVPMHDTPHGSYAAYTSPDVFVDDIDFRTARSFSRIDFVLLDFKYQVLTIDPRFPVIVQLKVYHTDTTKG